MQTSRSHWFVGRGSTEEPCVSLPVAQVTFHPYFSMSFQLACLISRESPLAL